MSQARKYTPNNNSLPVEQGKVPPQALDMEANILGICMDMPELFEQVLAILPNEECFYSPANQKIYAAMIRLYGSGAPIDSLTVSAELQKTGDLEQVGGLYALMNMIKGVTTWAHLEAHCRIVMEKSIKRQLIRAGYEAVKSGYDDSIDAYE